MPLPLLVGIVNITDDSFSDGGRFLAPEAAIAHARSLADDGADIVELGAAASNVAADHVSPDAEIGPGTRGADAPASIAAIGNPSLIA